MQSVLALGRDQTARDGAVQKTGTTINDLLQRASAGWVVMAEEEDPGLTQTTELRQRLESRIYTMALIGWFAGRTCLECAGFRAPEWPMTAAEKLGDLAAKLAFDFKPDLLPDMDFYCLDNFRGLAVDVGFLGDFGLSMQHDADSPRAQLLWMLGHTTLYWGYCLAQAEEQVTL